MSISYKVKEGKELRGGGGEPGWNGAQAIPKSGTEIAKK
jgi:hypothetical protein